jgi:acyl transferase domain-containing protein
VNDETGMTPLKRAFLALEDTRARLAAAEAATREPIAIIGLGCRVPGGGHDAGSFWALMRDGVDAIGPLPADRWDVEGTYDPDPDVPGCIATRAGGFIGDVRGFDPAHFGIARREAQGMDPQQRLFLEVAWEALEHAGQAPDRLERSSTGVYLGVTGSDYAYLQFETRDRTLLDAHFTSGIAHSIASGRLSYLLGLQGPAITIDTACSSSLVAVHLACQALRAGDCRMALAGGVNLILSSDLYIALSHSRMLAPDGRCKTFDAAADGFARGEGCGVLVLKRLSQAQADGDRVLAVIRGSALNQDGPSSGLTAPNGPAQEAVIREALARAGIAPRQVSFIEAHGTGTQLGDPLEVGALGSVFGADREPARPLLIGSVKTNIGHLEAAAGVTGLIKLVLSLQQRMIPAHLHFKQPSPHIAWDEWPVRVPTVLTPWEPIDGRRIAGVSSFGFSGTNAHVVVEEAPLMPAMAVADVADAPRAELFVLSGRDDAALAAMARRYAESLARPGVARLADLCFSASQRAHLPQRATVLARSVPELRERLAALAEGRILDGVHVARVSRRDPARIAFLFTGQGAQYAGMARVLDASEPEFRAALDRCARVLDARLERPLRELLFTAPGEATRLDETGFTQPALFAIEYALASLWRSWGVQPDVLMGHSVGEWVAACLGEVCSLDDALVLIAERGRLMQSLPPGGAMAAVFASEADVAAAIAGQPGAIAIAAQNGPLQTVISGAAAAVDDAVAAFTARGIRCQRLPVSHAFHSPLVDPVLDRFEAAVAQVTLKAPTLRIVSNLTGQLADAREMVQPRYWRRHLREAVRFADGLSTLATLRPDVCLEIGPHPTLLAFAQANFEAFGAGATPQLVGSLRKGRDDLEQMSEALGALYLAGVAIDWRAVWSARPHRQVDLPAYAFQREPLWFPQRPVAGGFGTAAGHGHPLLGTRLRSALRDVVQFESALRAADLPFINDHRVQGQAILPATGFLEMGLAAARAVLGGVGEVRDLAIMEPMRFDGDETRFVQVMVRPQPDGGARFEVLSVQAGRGGDPPGGDWRRHAEGVLMRVTGSLDNVESVEAVRQRCTSTVGAPAHQAALSARGLAFGPALHGVRSIRYTHGEALGEIVLPEPAIAGRGDYVMHPALLDACLQVLSAAVTTPGGADVTGGRAFLPLAIEALQFVRASRGVVWSHARVHAGNSAATLKGDLTLLDADGVVARMRGIALRATVPLVTADESLYEIAWQPWAGDDARWLPTPAALNAAAAPALQALLQEHRLESYQQAFVQLEALCTQWIVDALAALGWRPQPGEHVERGALAARLGVAPRYERLLGRLLAVLAEDGLLRGQADGWQVLKPLVHHGSAEGAARLQHLLERHPDSVARLTLAGRCGPSLAGILRGEVDPLQQLFPGGSTELAESLYRDAPEAKAFNQLMREAVRHVVGALPEGGRVRVLEVGGGTGGTTSWVAPALPAGRAEYLFTDVGPSLVMKARDKFSAHGFMQFQVLDLEQPVESQGLGERRFDLILASNVVHATADLRQTLARLRGLLSPGGTLLMLEVAGLERWIDITFGLTEGWWRFTDTALRRDYPLLSRASWLQLLHDCDFHAASLGERDDRTREVLLAARRPVEDVQPPAGRWLLVGDAGGLADETARQLAATGAQALRYDGQADDAASLRHFIVEHAQSCAGVLHLACLDLECPGTTGGASLLPAQAASLGSLLTVVKALGACSFASGSAPRLVIATCGAVMPEAQSPPGLRLAQTPVWGLGRAIALEHPEWRCVRIDLDPQDSLATQAGALRLRMASSTSEDQLAIRGERWFAARLARHVPRAQAVAPCRLEKGSGGTFDELALRPMQRRVPGRGEVEIRMHAAGLNFRDVMNALAMRDDPEPLGGECAGRIVAVGEGVTGFSVGDDVVAIAEASFASHATTTAALVRRLPAGLGFAEAATLPFAFMTAWHALHALGGLRRGETVLVHAGAGGVGMAAIQIARAAGARVFATAGSEAKRELLRSLGVDAVFDSRTLGFAEQVQEVTRGLGVDLVLNSLAGEFIGASVRCLAPAGRFLEIGKRDIWSAKRFAEQRPRGHYHAIDLNAMRIEQPAATAALFDGVMAAIEAGTLGPLPRQCFPLERAADAFRYMAMARHVGKVVLTQVDHAAASLDSIDERASYLVTGGLSGLGLLTAQLLVERGARHLWLVGRRAPTPEALRALDELRARGAQVSTLQADIARPDEVRRVLADIAPETPLRGIVHSAGLLEDGALMQQSWERFLRPLGPKVDGSWALHEATLGARLDFFVLYSSIASVLGSSGQGNHAAANAFMDALAAQRQAQGLPGLAISWGAWSEIGAAADRRIDERVAAQGLGVIAPQRGLQWLQQLMAGTAAHVGVCPVRWDAFLARPGARTPFVSGFVTQAATEARASGAAAPQATAGTALLEQLQQASASRRHELLLGFVGDHVARVVGASGRETIDVRQPLNEMGLDSLMAVELRNRLGSGLGLARSLPATLVFDHPTLEALATYLGRDVLPPGEAPGAEASASAAPADAVRAIDDLSDEEIERLFATKMKRS